MINKLYEKMKYIIKNYGKDILILFILTLIVVFPVPYYIAVSGGTININDRVKIDDEYKSKGTFNLAYVSELRGTIPTYLLSYIIPSWERSKIDDYKASSNESASDIMLRDKLELESSNLNALKVAYTTASKPLEIINNKYHILYVDDRIKEDLRIGDILESIDGKIVNDIKDYKSVVESKNFGDTVEVVVSRNGKRKTLNLEVLKIDNKKLTGIATTNIFEYKASPNIKFKFAKSESGPSGGLMLTLAIYDKLVEEDITKGKKIVGTGTIDEDGNVGEIGGVKYKLYGAVKAKADVFLAPAGDNYKECIKLQKEKKYKIKIIEVATFSDAIEKLKNI